MYDAMTAMFTDVKNAEYDRLWTMLNPTPELELFWSGRADIRIQDDGTVELSVLDWYEKRVEPIMTADGYKMVGKPYGLDLGDDDCPKPCTFTTWKK